MWWMFVRDFYRAGEAHAPRASAPAAPTFNADDFSSADFDPERILAELNILKDELADAHASLELAERARSAFLSAMSHELRTPLNAIMGFSEMMKSGIFGPLPDGPYQNYAEHIHDSGKLLLNKVDDLLGIANMDAQGITMEEAPCNARQLLGEVVEIHSHDAFQRKQQKLAIDCAGNITLRADRVKLLCALSHFVANAIRHSADGAEITLACRAVPGEGIIFSVRDTGEGIPQAQLDSIRAALQGTTSYAGIQPGGIGLGLALAGELANAHGGRVMVDSLRHRGTVVSLILPAERALAGMPAKKRSRG